MAYSKAKLKNNCCETSPCFKIWNYICNNYPSIN